MNRFRRPSIDRNPDSGKILVPGDQFTKVSSTAVIDAVVRTGSPASPMRPAASRRLARRLPRPTRSGRMARTDPSSKRSWVVSTTRWISTIPPIPSTTASTMAGAHQIGEERFASTTAARWRSLYLQQVAQATNSSDPRPAGAEFFGVREQHRSSAAFGATGSSKPNTFRDQPFPWTRACPRGVISTSSTANSRRRNSRGPATQRNRACCTGRTPEDRRSRSDWATPCPLLTRARDTGIKFGDVQTAWRDKSSAPRSEGRWTLSSTA